MHRLIQSTALVFLTLITATPVSAFSQGLREDSKDALAPIRVEKLKPPSAAAARPVSEEPGAKYTPQATAMLLNYCRESLYKIVEFNDRTVLDDEYNKLVNNIDITRIQDDEAAHLIETFLTQLNALKLNEAERKALMDAYNRKVQSLVLSIFQGSRAVNMKEVKGVMKAAGQPATAACEVLLSVVAGVASYKGAIAKQQREIKMRMMQLQADELNRLTVLRTKFFDTEYKLYKRYDLPDRLNVKEVQLAQYIKVIADEDSPRRLERLDRLKADFDAFPPFWYQIGKAAQESGNVTIAKSYYAHFEQIQTRVFREDQDYVKLCMHRVMLLDPDKDADAIRQDLRTIEENTRYYYQWEDVLFAALMYYQLGDLENARRLIRTSINEGYCVQMHETVMTDMESEAAKANIKKAAGDQIKELVGKTDQKELEGIDKVGPGGDLDTLRAMGSMLTDITMSIEVRSHAAQNATYLIPGYNVYSAGRAIVKGDAYLDNCIVQMPITWLGKNPPRVRLMFKGHTFKPADTETDPKAGVQKIAFSRVLKQNDVVEKKQQYPLTFHIETKTAILDIEFEIKPVTPQLQKIRPDLSLDVPYFEMRAIHFKDRVYRVKDGLITYDSP